MAPPLCVDLDGTLIRGDTLWESVMQAGRHPKVLLKAVWTLRKGKAALKQFLATEGPIDPALLVYRSDLLDYLRQARRSGRRIVLATATHPDVAQRMSVQFD